MVNWVSSWNLAVTIGPDLTTWAWNMIMFYTFIHGGVHWAWNTMNIWAKDKPLSVEKYLHQKEYNL